VEVVSDKKSSYLQRPDETLAGLPLWRHIDDNKDGNPSTGMELLGCWDILTRCAYGS
jgi:hypothetical protein